jgi:hypothetical protein
MYGTLCRILSDELRDKVQRAPNYVQASELSDPIALWAIIVATAGMHLDPGDGDDAGQSVKIQYQTRYQSLRESLLLFYNATQLLLKNMILLDVPDAPTSASAAQDFLSKMDMGRYGRFSPTSLVAVATVQSLKADYSKRKIKAASVARADGEAPLVAAGLILEEYRLHMI